MLQLSLTLFGSFAAAVHNATLHLPTDKARALLVYLALTPDTPLRREMLAGLLWPEQSEAMARQNLRQTAGRLKRVIHEKDPDLAGRLLTLTKQTIELHAAYCQADVHSFRRHLVTAHHHPHDSLDRCPACLAGVETAVALYRRGDLLSGFSLPDAAPFEEWLLLQRENLYQQQLNALHNLTVAYEEQGLLDRARQTARWQIQQEPWREEAHRQLMRLLATAGQRAAAIAQYQACRQTLQDELGIDPSPETEALLTQIMEGSLPVIASRKAEARPPSLPQPVGPLIGRDIELAEILVLLAEPACRLLTMSGPGGIGKTSLALAVGKKLSTELPSWFTGGVYFVPLAEVTNSSQLPSVLAATVGIELNQRRTIASQVEQFLQPKSLLLILDNVEHLVEEAAWLRSLLDASTHLKYLVTSREPLNWQGEWRYPLEGLAYPQDDVEGGQFGAVQLFVQAARQVEPGFSYSPENRRDIVRICQLLYGWPLALRMAAAWVRVMSCAAIAAQITTSLDFLTTSMRDIPPRHRSMRAIFDHTWSSLSEAEQRLLCQLAVFRGGFTLAAAHETSAASPLLLRALVDKALVQYDQQSGRYQLHELLLQFALQKAGTDPGSHDRAQQSHSRYYLRLLQSQGDRLNSASAQSALEVIRADVDNVRRAWLWAASHQEHDLLAASLSQLALFLERAAPPQETIAFYRRTIVALEESAGDKPVPLIAHVLHHMANRLLFTGQYGEATATLTGAREMASSLDDVSLASLLSMTQAHVYREQGQYEQALAILAEALALSQRCNYREGVARALHHQGNTLWYMADYEQAGRCYEEGRRIYEELGQVEAATTLTGNIGVVQWRLGQHHEALALYEVTLRAVRQVGDIARIALWLGNVALVYVDLCDDERALSHIDEALDLHDQIGRSYYKIDLLLGKVAIYLRRGDINTAIELHQQALELSYLIGNHTYLLDCDLWQARLFVAQHRTNEAVQLLQSMARREFRPDAAATIVRELEQLSI
jgi:predicted ATPase/DNA-binding SARP family transcriptional activator